MIRNMNQRIENIPSGTISATELPDWALAHGIGSLTTGDVAHLIGVPASHVLQRMAPRLASGVATPAGRNFRN